MKNLTIGFSKPKKWKPFAWLIMKAYGIPYDHVYIRFHSDTCDRDLIYQASKMMVNFVGMSVFTSENTIVKEFQTGISDDNFVKFMQFAIDNAGKPYGILEAVGLGIVRLARWFGKSINNPFSDGYRTYVCCEMAAFVLRDYEGMKFSEDPETIDPKELYDFLK